MRFAIIGCGVIAVTHAMALAALPEQELYACCDIIPEKADAFAAEYRVEKTYYDWRQLLSDGKAEAVCICTPSDLHGEMAVAAMRAGKAVVCEKPLEVTAERAQAVVDAAEETGAKVQCIFQRRLLPAARTVRELIAQGKLGRICLATAELKYYRDQAYYDSAGWRNVCGGAMLNQGVHGIALLLWMLGEPVKTIFGYAGTLARQTGVEDTAAALLTMDSGALCVIKNTTLAYPEFPTGFCIHGEKGTVAFDDLGVNTWEFLDKADAPAHPKADPAFAHSSPISLKPYYGNMHAYLLQDLADAVREDREPMIPPREAITAVRTICGIARSASLGGPVNY